MKILEVKQSIKEGKLLRDIIKELQREMKKTKKELRWFQFAKKTQYSWKFLKNKEKQWEILGEIAKKISKKYTKYTNGEIVDLISELVNTQVKDDIMTHGLKVKKQLSPKEKIYLEKLLIEVVNLSYYIPRHSNLMPVKKISKNSWKARNLASNEINTVKQLKKGNFVLYNIS